MSTPGDNRNFRRVDVDKYDENAFEEDASTETSSFNESEVSSMINGRNYSGAIKAISSSSVISSDSTKDKISLVDAFLRLNQNIKTTNIPELVNGLSEEEKNNLMKVIYMAFKSKPEADHTLTHSWFDKVFQDVGHGAIVRVMTDRKAAIFKT